MSKILVALVATLSCLPLPLFGQSTQVDVSVGEPYEVINAGTNVYFHEGDEILSIKFDKNKLYIQKFSTNNLTQIHRKEYLEKFLPSQITIEHVGKVGGKYLLFYKVFNKQNKTEDLWAKEIGFEEGMLIGNSIHLLHVDDKVADLSLNYRQYISQVPDLEYSSNRIFDFRYSLDSSKFLIAYKKKPTKRINRNNYEVLGFHVFTPKLEKLWNKEIKMPYSEYELDLLDYSISSNGTLSLLTYVEQEEPTDLPGIYKKKHWFELLSTNQDQEELSSAILKFKPDIIEDLALIESKPNQLQCIGFYRSKTNDLNRGMLKVNFNKDHKECDFNYYPFDESTIYDFEIRNKERYNLDYSNLMIKNVDTSSGEITVLGERLYAFNGSIAVATGPMAGSIAFNINSGKLSSKQSDYHYGNILTLKIDKDDNLIYTTKIPKHTAAQEYSRQYGASFKVINLGKHEYYFFINHETNESITPKEGLNSSSSGQGDLIAYKINPENGTKEKISILNTRRFNEHGLEHMASFRFIKINEHEVVFEAYKDGQEDVLVKISLAL